MLHTGVAKDVPKVMPPIDFPGNYNDNILLGGARGVMVIVVGNGHGDTSSNPGRDWLHFT